jgi:hypothetical protein
MPEIRLNRHPAAGGERKTCTQADSTDKFCLADRLPDRSSLENDSSRIDTLARLTGGSEPVRAGESDHVAFASGHLVGEALEEAA